MMSKEKIINRSVDIDKITKMMLKQGIIDYSISDYVYNEVLKEN